jgi:hypothetical protein
MRRKFGKILKGSYGVMLLIKYFVCNIKGKTKDVLSFHAFIAEI